MTSKYHQIINDIERDIQEHVLKQGQKLPSIRHLSQQYRCSKDTVQRALLELKYRRLIYSVPKSGYYILGKVGDDHLQSTVSLKDYNNMAYEEFRLCLNEALAGKEAYLFNYYHQGEGLEDLLLSLLPHLADHGIYTTQNQLIVTAGTQQALYILSQMPFPNGRKEVLLEKPTYHRMESLISSLNIPFKTIGRGTQGLDFQELEQIFKTGSIKFFYTISRFSNPLGLSYNNKEKEKLIELAQQYDVYLLEDDYLGDFAKSSEPPLHYYDTHHQVIYLKSFSMSVFPALRLGALVLPEPLKANFLHHKSMIDLDTNLMMQKALSLYLDNGMFQKNLKQIKQFFKKREDELKSDLQRLAPDLTYRLTPKELIVSLDSPYLVGRAMKLERPRLITDSKEKYLSLDINSETASQLAKLYPNQDIKKTSPSI